MIMKITDKDIRMLVFVQSNGTKLAFFFLFAYQNSKYLLVACFPFLKAFSIRETVIGSLE